jgi:hypothetical protein
MIMSESQSLLPTIHIECGASPQRRLTISFEPTSVRLWLKDGSSVELNQGRWEYGFTSNDPLEVSFESAATFTCTVNRIDVPTTGAGPHWVCQRPASDIVDYGFTFTSDPKQPTLGIIKRPAAAQPTLIIRTKRICPTGPQSPGTDE